MKKLILTSLVGFSLIGCGEIKKALDDQKNKENQQSERAKELASKSLDSMLIGEWVIVQETEYHFEACEATCFDRDLQGWTQDNLDELGIPMAIDQFQSSYRIKDSFTIDFDQNLRLLASQFETIKLWNAYRRGDFNGVTAPQSKSFETLSFGKNSATKNFYHVEGAIDPQGPRLKRDQLEKTTIVQDINLLTPFDAPKAGDLAYHIVAVDNANLMLRTLDPKIGNEFKPSQDIKFQLYSLEKATTAEVTKINSMVSK